MGSINKWIITNNQIKELYMTLQIVWILKLIVHQVIESRKFIQSVHIIVNSLSISKKMKVLFKILKIIVETILFVMK